MGWGTANVEKGGLGIPVFRESERLYQEGITGQGGNMP
jgi:hypothetical protein